MWIRIAFAAGVIAVAAAPELFPGVSAAPEPVPAALRLSKPAPKTFKPVCRGDELLDSRPDPAWVRQGFAGDNCRAPSLPPLLDGARASREQVVAAMADAKSYTAKAAAFERCVSDFIAAKRSEAAAGGKGLTQPQIIIENHRILVSQRAAQRAEAQARVAINDFNHYGSSCEQD